jgi:hypothetical protein
MGDLPGSPSVAPSPLFCTAPWGEPRDCPDSPGWCGTGLRGRPGASTRRRRGQIGGQHRRPRAGGTEAVSTPLYAAPSVAAELTPFCPSSSFFSLLVSSRVFLLPGEGRCSRGPGCGIRRRPEKWQSHPAPCGAAEERRENAGSVRFGSSVPGGRPPLPHGPVMSVEGGEGA